MKRTIIAAILCVFLGSAYAMEFLPALDINGGLTYPTGVSGDVSGTARGLDKRLAGEADLAGSFMVNTDFLPQLWFIPTLTANYSSTGQPLLVEDQRFVFSSWLDTYMSAGFNYQFDDNWELRARGLLRFDYSQQTVDETIGKGLYDYIDKGFYLENSNKFGTDVAVEVLEGAKYIDKRFPNYQTLASKVNPDTIGGTLNAKAKNEKDNLGYSAYVTGDFQLGNSGWFPVLSFTYEYLRYLDQKKINLDGTLSDSNRIDRSAIIDLDFPYFADKVSGLDLGYALTIRTVSQNYYDSMDTPDPADDTYLINYYNNFESVIKASFTYELDNAFINSNKPTLTVGINADLVAYTERLAKDRAGTYTANKQFDFNYTLFLEFKHKLADFWNYYLNATFNRYNSNMKWDAYGAFNYTFFTITLGTGLSF
jgi:hypothetical protein